MSVAERVEYMSSNGVKGSRTPDLMFFTAAKWAQYTAETENWLKKPAQLVPDLAVEVLSPNDSFSEVQAKVDEYLARGVLLVWVFDPDKKRVYVYQGDRKTTLDADATLTGSDVLPGVAIPLTDIFRSTEIFGLSVEATFASPLFHLFSERAC